MYILRVYLFVKLINLYKLRINNEYIACPNQSALEKFIKAIK